MSFGTSLDQAFEAKAKKDFQGGMRNMTAGIGRPYGFGSDSSTNGKGAEGINWQDYNYPPLARLIHYREEELPKSTAAITRLMKIFFEIQCVACGVTVFNAFILLIAADLFPTKHFFYALLNCLILPPLALFIFYQGYRGLALSSASLLQQYKMFQGVALVFTFLFVIVPMGSINGFGRFGTDNYKHSPSGKGYWGFAIVVESLIYLVNFVVGGRAWMQVWQYNPYAKDAGDRPTNPAPPGAGGGVVPNAV